MEHQERKEQFLRKEYTSLLKTLAPDTPAKWGKMNLQQMIEHMSDYVRISSGRDPQLCVTPPDHLEKMRAFMLSEKNFRENTPNTLMPQEPPPPRHDRIQDAIEELNAELAYFFKAFQEKKDLKTTHPFFGALDYGEHVHLLYKHAWHHLRQFGLEHSAG